MNHDAASGGALTDERKAFDEWVRGAYVRPDLLPISKFGVEALWGAWEARATSGGAPREPTEEWRKSLTEVTDMLERHTDQGTQAVHPMSRLMQAINRARALLSAPARQGGEHPPAPDKVREALRAVTQETRRQVFRDVVNDLVHNTHSDMDAPARQGGETLLYVECDCSARTAAGGSTHAPNCQLMTGKRASGGLNHAGQLTLYPADRRATSGGAPREPTIDFAWLIDRVRDCYAGIPVGVHVTTAPVPLLVLVVDAFEKLASPARQGGESVQGDAVDVWASIDRKVAAETASAAEAYRRYQERCASAIEHPSAPEVRDGLVARLRNGPGYEKSLHVDRYEAAARIEQLERERDEHRECWIAYKRRMDQAEARLAKVIAAGNAMREWLPKWNAPANKKQALEAWDRAIKENT